MLKRSGPTIRLIFNRTEYRSFQAEVCLPFSELSHGNLQGLSNFLRHAPNDPAFILDDAICRALLTNQIASVMALCKPHPQGLDFVNSPTTLHSWSFVYVGRPPYHIW